MQKRGLSPVIATVLLVALVVVLGLIVFLWFKSISKEVVTKFEDENIELACEEVDFQASYSSGVLSISNIGTVSIYSFEVKEYKSDGFSTEDIKDLSDVWPVSGLAQGKTFYDNIGEGLDSSTEKIVIIPVLAGNSESGERTATCDESLGYETSV